MTIKWINTLICTLGMTLQVRMHNNILTTHMLLFCQETYGSTSWLRERERDLLKFKPQIWSFLLLYIYKSMGFANFGNFANLWIKFRAANKQRQKPQSFLVTQHRKKGEWWLKILWGWKIRSYEKYLGLPSLVGRNKKASFNYIKERVWRKLQGWEEQLLS